MVYKRTEKEIFDTILNVANEHDFVRAVILNGSKADKNCLKDDYQDFDILFIVKNVEYIVNSKIFPDKLGKILIMQTPDKMDGIWPDNKDKYTYLMLFEDENRVDLKLINDSVYKKSKKDSLSLVLLDKDQKYSFLKDPNDLDYVIKKPTNIEFKNLCNEFLWLSTYVAKGLARKQILYSKHCLDVLLRDELSRILAIKVNIETNFAKNLGAFYKYLENYLDSDTLILFLNTYTDFNISKNWDSLFSMCQIFHASASFISKKLNFEFNEKEYNNVLNYLKSMRAK